VTYPYRIGRILRAHGLAGDLTVQLFRPRALRPKRMRPKRAQKVEIGEREYVLHAVQGTAADRAIVHLLGVEDRTAAERLEGEYLDVDPKDLPSLLTDEIDRLFGLTAVDPKGAVIGEIVDIRDNGAQALLIIGEEILVPAPFVVEVRGGEVVIDAPEGLFELG
jgi:16S rRNA processing protein RimM